MAKIKTLKDNENNIVYPQSMTAAILDTNGTTLDTLIAEKANISDVYTKSEIEDTYVKKNEIPTAISQLEDDINLITRTETSPLPIIAIWAGSQEEYDALTEWNEAILYLIKET